MLANVAEREARYRRYLAHEISVVCAYTSPGLSHRRCAAIVGQIQRDPTKPVEMHRCECECHK